MTVPWLIASRGSGKKLRTERLLKSNQRKPMKKKTLLILCFCTTLWQGENGAGTSTLLEVEWRFARSGPFNLNEELAGTLYGERVDFSTNLDSTETVQIRTPISQQAVKNFNSLQNIVTVCITLFIIQKHSSSTKNFVSPIFVFHIILWFNYTPVQHSLTSLSTGDVFSKVGT